ncbi:putative SUN domain protein [Giardia muris]|uniref:Putative SUN domain protein n=1 Tax=Giardia muris TaxID=5742 RepID=A0A4Z1T6V5_GIAMU|nr:putative SUN domain protein [Giardia muris]|eukprot:TNJ28221.1 putative SUN domain protein [Giardia muris]
MPPRPRRTVTHISIRQTKEDEDYKREVLNKGSEVFRSQLTSGKSAEVAQNLRNQDEGTLRLQEYLMAADYDARPVAPPEDVLDAGGAADLKHSISRFVKPPIERIPESPAPKYEETSASVRSESFQKQSLPASSTTSTPGLAPISSTTEEPIPAPSLTDELPPTASPSPKRLRRQPPIVRPAEPLEDEYTDEYVTIKRRVRRSEVRAKKVTTAGEPGMLYAYKKRWSIIEYSLAGACGVLALMVLFIFSYLLLIMFTRCGRGLPGVAPVVVEKNSACPKYEGLSAADIKSLSQQLGCGNAKVNIDAITQELSHMLEMHYTQLQGRVSDLSETVKKLHSAKDDTMALDKKSLKKLEDLMANFKERVTDDVQKAIKKISAHTTADSGSSHASTIDLTGLEELVTTLSRKIENLDALEALKSIPTTDFSTFETKIVDRLGEKFDEISASLVKEVKNTVSTVVAVPSGDPVAVEALISNSLDNFVSKLRILLDTQTTDVRMAIGNVSAQFNDELVRSIEKRLAELRTGEAGTPAIAEVDLQKLRAELEVVTRRLSTELGELGETIRTAIDTDAAQRYEGFAGLIRSYLERRTTSTTTTSNTAVGGVVDELRLKYVDYARQIFGTRIASRSDDATNFAESVKSFVSGNDRVRLMFTEDLSAGSCWPTGRVGYVVFRFKSPVSLLYGAVSHPAAPKSPSGRASAPKTLTFTGKTTQGMEVRLGTFEFVEDGPEQQAFELEPNTDLIQVRVEFDNHGADYTCVYNLGLFGNR